MIHVISLPHACSPNPNPCPQCQSTCIPTASLLPHTSLNFPEVLQVIEHHYPIIPKKIQILSAIRPLPTQHSRNKRQCRRQLPPSEKLAHPAPQPLPPPLPSTHSKPHVTPPSASIQDPNRNPTRPPTTTPTTLLPHPTFSLASPPPPSLPSPLPSTRTSTSLLLNHRVPKTETSIRFPLLTQGSGKSELRGDAVGFSNETGCWLYNRDR